MAGRGSKPGERRGGRQRGTPNKTTASVKQALSDAFDKRGGVPALIRWAAENETEFYKLWGRLAPTEIVGEKGGPVQVAVRFLREGRRVTAS